MRSYTKAKFYSRNNSFSIYDGDSAIVDSVWETVALYRQQRDPWIFMSNLLCAKDHTDPHQLADLSWYLYDDLFNVIRTVQQSYLLANFFTHTPYTDHPLN